MDPVNSDQQPNIFTLLALLFLLIAPLVACAAAAPEGQFPETSSRGAALLSVMLTGQAKPDGANNPNCTPQEGKTHVVLIHGTFSSSVLSYGALAPRLANAGYCVYATDYGGKEPDDWFKATGPVAASAAQVGQFVDSVLKTTRASKVDLIGHSQGGLIGFYLLKELGYAPKVRHFVALAPSVSGTVLANPTQGKNIGYCIACNDQHPESEIVKQLNNGPVTQPGVLYTVLATQNDYVVRPVEKQFVREPGVLNLYIQDQLPGKFATHSNMLYDDEVLDLITELLPANNRQ